MRRVVLLFAALALMGCPNNPSPPGDAGVDAGPMTLRPCLDRPGNEPPGAPGAALPCDLLPPSFGQ
ncbi:MAG: hypothetical protein JNK82_23625 [Myxococcaceae bacterium]|nr:hypothetical protein [Myxococcaceae bacterium]